MAQKIDIDALTAHARKLAAEVSTWSVRQLRVGYAQERTLAQRGNSRAERAPRTSTEPPLRNENRSNKNSPRG